MYNRNLQLYVDWRKTSISSYLVIYTRSWRLINVYWQIWKELFCKDYLQE